VTSHGLLERTERAAHSQALAGAVRRVTHRFEMLFRETEIVERASVVRDDVLAGGEVSERCLVSGRLQCNPAAEVGVEIQRDDIIAQHDHGTAVSAPCALTPLKALYAAVPASSCSTARRLAVGSLGSLIAVLPSRAP
jgi:hypothetical protein